MITILLSLGVGFGPVLSQGSSSQQAPKLPIVQILDSSRSPTERERTLAREVTNTEFEEIRKGDDREGINYKDKAFFLIDRAHPLLRPLRDEAALLRAMPNAGTLVSFSELPKSGREALERALGDAFPNLGKVPGDALFMLTADPVYEVSVGGKTRTLTGPSKKSLDEKSLGALLKSASVGPTAAAAGRGRQSNGAARPESLAMLFPPRRSQLLARLELAMAGAELMSKMAAEELAKLDKAQAEWLRRFLEANGGSMDELPHNGRSLDQLPSEVRDALADSFVSSYMAYGFDSQESARTAWADAKLVDSFMRIGVFFMYDSGSGPRLTQLEISTTKGRP